MLGSSMGNPENATLSRGIPFHDHNPTTRHSNGYRTSRTRQARLARWSLELQDNTILRLSIEKAPTNLVADALSRQPDEIHTVDDPPACTWFTRLKAQVQQEPEKHPEYRLAEGRLYRRFPDYTGRPTEQTTEWKLCVPRPQRAIVLAEKSRCSDCRSLGDHQDRSQARRTLLLARDVSRSSQVRPTMHHVPAIQNPTASAGRSNAHDSRPPALGGGLRGPRRPSSPVQQGTYHATASSRTNSRNGWRSNPCDKPPHQQSPGL